MHLENMQQNQRLPVNRAARHLIVFQIKLFVDAIRDLILSPVSLVCFFIDALTRPNVEDSLSLKLMHVGRRSDRVINLFDEYSGSGDFTIDETVKEVESVLNREIEEYKKRH